MLNLEQQPSQHQAIEPVTRMEMMMRAMGIAVLLYVIGWLIQLGWSAYQTTYFSISPLLGLVSVWLFWRWIFMIPLALLFWQSTLAVTRWRPPVQ